MVKIDEIPESVPEMATLTPEKEELITELLSKVDELYKDKTPFYIARESTPEKRRIFAYKALTARKWKVKNALEMIEKTVAFRAQHKMDEWKLFPCAFPLRGYDEVAICAMLSTMPGCESLFPRDAPSSVDACYRALQSSYVNVYHYWDKEGHPVLYDCCGRADVPQVLRNLAQITPSGKSLGDVIVPYHTYMNEVQYYVIEHANRVSQQAGRHPIMGITVVMDMEGLSFNVVRRSFIQVIRAIFDVDQSYYPEVLHRLFILNAPSFFRMAYDCVKGSLDENTRRKLVFSSDKKEAVAILKRVIDEDKIPAELGGSCRCDGGCLPRYVRSPTTSNASDSLPASSAVNHDDVDADEESAQTDTVYLKAGKEWSKSLEIFAGEKVTWEYSVAKGADIAFTAAFDPSAASDGEEDRESILTEKSANSKKSSPKHKAKKGSAHGAAREVLKEEKANLGIGTYKVTNPGTLTLTLSNKHSWVHGKEVELVVMQTRDLS